MPSARTLTLGLLALAAPVARAEEPRVGLAPDAVALTQAEAQTASARGSSALFYNPAGLARWAFGLSLVEYYQTVDQEALDVSRHRQRASERGEDPDLSEIYSYLASGKRFAFEYGAVLVRLQLPYSGAQGFAYGRSTVQQTVRDGDPAYDFETVLHVGAAAGFAATYKKLSLGYSRYYLIRSRVTATPTVAQVEDYAARLSDGSMRPQDIPHQEFARVELGNGFGTNLGLLVRPWDDNPSALGVSALNAFGTRFRREPLIKGERAERFDQRIEKFADRHSLALETPADLAPMYNAGITLGTGGGREDYLVAVASLDYQDIGGEAITHKLAGSGELGFQLPDKVAKVAAYQFEIPGHPRKYQVGFLAARLLAGVREGEYSSYGFGITLHGGAEGVSPLKLTVSNYVREAMAGGHRRQGIAADLGFTLIY